jgi:hypothetical protein
MNSPTPKGTKNDYYPGSKSPHGERESKRQT